MVTVQQIGWGKYGGFEGPYFWGSIKYSLPENPTEDERRVRVLTATEGGAYDAVNMYDKCIVSVGLIQWCEATYTLTSRLLHAVCEACGPEGVLSALKPALDLTGSEFKKNTSGQWRFHVGGREVNTLIAQQTLFLGCSGQESSWNDKAKAQAKLWAACMANVWTDPKAQRVQADYTGQRLMGFVVKDASKILFDDKRTNDGYVGMLRAAFLSFAGNNPKHASEEIVKIAAASKSVKWTRDWCIAALKQLTFGPHIAIYGERYDKIRPWLEQLWVGVSLPKTHEELLAWSEPVIAPPAVPLTPPKPPVPTEIVEHPLDEHPVVIPEVVVEVKVEAPKPPPLPTRPPIVNPPPVPIVTPEASTGALGLILKLLMKLFGIGK